MKTSWGGFKEKSRPSQIELYVNLTRSFSAYLARRPWLLHFD